MENEISGRTCDFEELVFRGVESDELDYKAPMSWTEMSRAAKGKIVRHLTAFANTKGGYLVIGVGEDSSGNPVLRNGVSLREAGSFDPTPVGNFIAHHIEPTIDFTIERPVIRGKKYVIFVVKPFRSVPHVCCNPIEGELQAGVFYIRTKEASSRPARRAIEMQSLIRRAMRNEREQLGRMLRGILYESRLTGGAERVFADTIEDSTIYFKRRTRDGAFPILRFTVEPQDNLVKLSKNELSSLVEAAWRLKPGTGFIADGELQANFTPGSLRYLSPERMKMWQLFDNGLFCYFINSGKLNTSYQFERVVNFCVEAIDFTARLYAELEWAEQLLTLQVAIINADNMSLCTGEDEAFHVKNNTVSVEICRSAADLASGRENHAASLVRRLGEAFHLPDFRVNEFISSIRKYLDKQ